jgi:NTP pyrophosphatase (non-canonical NTP hydrolase)
MMNLSDIQDTVKKWVSEKGFKWSTYAQYCHLVEEVGELGESIVVANGEREPGDGAKGLADHSDINEEIGDVLFSTIALANQYNIDIEKCFQNTLKRYDAKVRRRIG